MICIAPRREFIYLFNALVRSVAFFQVSRFHGSGWKVFFYISVFKFMHTSSGYYTFQINDVYKFSLGILPGFIACVLGLLISSLFFKDINVNRMLRVI